MDGTEGNTLPTIRATTYPTMKRNNKRGHLYRIENKLNSIEDAMTILIAALNRIHARLLTVEQQQREEFTDATINRLHASALRMKETADKELQALRERYGTPGI